MAFLGCTVCVVRVTELEYRIHGQTGEGRIQSSTVRLPTIDDYFGSADPESSEQCSQKKRVNEVVVPEEIRFRVVARTPPFGDVIDVSFGTPMGSEERPKGGL